MAMSFFRFPRPRSFLHLVSLRTATEAIAFTFAINKGTSLYGLLALLTGYHLDPLQLSHYIYSVLVLALGLYLTPAIRKRDADGALKVLGLAWVYVLDTIINTAYTILFSLGWFVVLSRHLDQDAAGVGAGINMPGSETINDTAGFTDPEHTVSKVNMEDKELTELRHQLRRRDKPSHVRDASEFELGEEETETGALQTRIRALEAENFDLRRGVWREKRAELQPGMQDDGAEYEDVDLNNSAGNNGGPSSPLVRGSVPRQHSNFQDLITSGISAFTGRPREVSGSIEQRQQQQLQQRQRQQSMSLLSEGDEGEFDAEAFRVAQEEEGKRRIERVREVKRGLEGWREWRVDLVEGRRGSAVGGGEVFEV
ncbi:hypothetical protein LTS16_016651 [Friedmanniomyces endolithicus]|nr:hypothetical protein LTR57_017078 [Friedmanniomyces endolithicus]KAK0961596.1 hypothetical protein LTS01_020277 [Friedmanniomyces endolithicus]KAK1033003.1 hypothetical protein LTS16_016651 [Friedmanniomyces endolithicus]